MKDPYVYEDTNVLINLANIKDQKELIWKTYYIASNHGECIAITKKFERAGINHRLF